MSIEYKGWDSTYAAAFTVECETCEANLPERRIVPKTAHILVDTNAGLNRQQATEIAERHEEEFGKNHELVVTGFFNIASYSVRTAHPIYPPLG